jgi:predicted  nucleic acid-binding Zn-ribbon protein
MNATEINFDHEDYERLCAMATTGTLSTEESERLSGHLAECPECREAYAQYSTIATDGMEFLAGEFDVPKTAQGFDEDGALARLMQATNESKPHVVTAQREKLPWQSRPSVRYGAGAALAASILIAVSVASYRIGSHAKPSADASPPASILLTQLAAQKQALQKMIETDDRRIADLAEEAAGSKTESDKLRAETRAASDQLADVAAAMTGQKQQSEAQIAALTQERDASAARLQDAQKLYQTVQDELNGLRSQHQQDLLRLASLDGQVTSLTASLKDSSTRAKDDEQYLSSDRDIRELIGARNLYIADILDVDESGQSRKPFGRVFYTKTKSLIFYAYDLDSQPGVRRTSTFQVWGRTGSRDRNPVNLGILYMDSEANRRWTLRVDNPEQLAQLDAVFVTVEPKPQVERPTGRPFLVASLRREPNHP